MFLIKQGTIVGKLLSYVNQNAQTNNLIVIQVADSSY